MRIDITARSQTAKWFEESREAFGEEHRDGNPPSRTEFLRILLTDFDRIPDERDRLNT